MSQESPRKTVYLHVGTHKTGTTSLQEVLRRHPDVLAENGLGFRTENARRRNGQRMVIGNSMRLAAVLLRDTLKTPFMIAHENWRRGNRARRLARMGGEMPMGSRGLIVSAEDLCFAREAGEAARIRALFPEDRCDIVPVITFRGEADWRASWAGQLTRYKAIVDGSAYLDGSERLDADWVFDRDAILSFWQGLGAPVVLDYDAELARMGSVLPGMLRAFGLDPERFDTDVWANRRRPPPPVSGG